MVWEHNHGSEKYRDPRTHTKSEIAGSAQIDPASKPADAGGCVGAGEATKLLSERPSDTRQQGTQVERHGLRADTHVAHQIDRCPDVRKLRDVELRYVEFVDSW